MVEKTLDCKGLMCPMPIVKISKEAKTMNKDDKLIVLATDPAFKPDIEAWTKKMNVKLESVTNENGVFKVILIL